MGRVPKVVVVILIGETAALLVLGGLLLSSRWADRTSNIVPGEADYPVINPQAAQAFQFDLLIPSTVNLDFRAVYTTTFGRGESPKPTRCHYITKEGTETEYSVSQTEFSVEIQLTKAFVADEPDSGGRSPHLRRYRASVLADRFQPGRCLWALDRITYQPQGSRAESELARVGPSRGRSDVLNVVDYLWCTSVPASREMPAHEACAGPTPDPLTAIDITMSPERAHPPAFSADSRGIEFAVNDVDHRLPVTITLPAKSK
jgi:hypothetical protein